uniref:N-acetyltransferase domain-containing protein n=1 Tax=Panagrellus redivivus TaxID=6233 RepID=A0A7E4VH39_PANRE
MLSRFAVKSKFVGGFRAFSTAVPPLEQKNYIIDARKPGERQQYGDVHVLKDGRSIRFEIADEKDTELVAEQFIDGFLKHTSILRAMNAKREDLGDLMYGMTREILPSGGTLLGLHENKVACFRMVRYVQHDKLEEMYGPLSKPGDPTPVPVFPEDYGALIDAVPEGSFPARVITVMLTVPERQLGKFLPLDIKNLAFGEAVNVHQEFQQNDLGTHISALSEKLAVENGCNYIGNITVAAASSRIAAKKGFKVLYSMPYDKFYVHGKLIFKNLWDGATASNLNLGKLE